MLNTVYGLCGVGALLVVALLVVLRGGPMERYAMAVAALGWVASLAMQGASGVLDPLFGLLTVDLTAFVALMGLIWRSRKRWPLFAVGFQGLAAGIDLVRTATIHLSSWIYLTALAVAGYGLLASIAVGAWTARAPPPGVAAND